jgi:hypothetical protein
MNVLARLQASAVGIVADIAAKVVEPFGAVDQMIELVLLPESSLAAEPSIDLNRREV